MASDDHVPETGSLPDVPADNRILFFRRDRADFGFLSHFHASPILLDGKIWPTVEHYYQAQKSLDPDYRRAIRGCTTPGRAKRRARSPGAAARQFSWFVEHGQAPRPDWSDVKRDIMRRADTAKYAQSPELACRLLATRDAEIIEDSDSESFWGWGPDGLGENWAGRILMEVRAALQMGEAGLPGDRL